VFGIFVSVIQFATIVNAFIKSLGERFTLGAIGALVRAALLILGSAGAVWSRFVSYPGSDIPAPALASFMVMTAVVLGPMLTGMVLWVAYRRCKDVPAAEEERLGRPFNAWLPVGLFDAVFVVISVFGLIMASRF
jgi:multisubunit Na+/H+ antiporter MnhC subunit